MAGKRNCSLFCAPQPLARFIQLFPKLALVFFVIHFTVMIYSFFSPTPHDKSKDAPPGVVDPKMKHFDTEYAQRIHTDLKNKTLHMKNDTALNKEKSKSIILQGLRPESRHGNSRGQNDKKRPSVLKNHPGR